MGDPLQTIGQILTGDEQRDAIHIAVLPAVAGEQLRPGDAVAISHGTSNVAIRALDEYGLQRSIGVVDPFIGTRPKAKVAGGIYDSDDAHYCVLGQMDGDYITGLNALGFNAYDVDDSVYGFDVPRRVGNPQPGYAALRDAWLVEIAQRLTLRVMPAVPEEELVLV